ncbi:hypothetical protein JHK82_050104 [Glycine max]|nr:hypothetical protein JHK85_050754 [Glycine max]KAG5091326.1 hypothetical protein JHK82_050104 [Glycine max]
MHFRRRSSEIVIVLYLLCRPTPLLNIFGRRSIPIIIVVARVADTEQRNITFEDLKKPPLGAINGWARGKVVKMVRKFPCEICHTMLLYQ